MGAIRKPGRRWVIPAVGGALVGTVVVVGLCTWSPEDKARRLVQELRNYERPARPWGRRLNVPRLISTRRNISDIQDDLAALGQAGVGPVIQALKDEQDHRMQGRLTEVLVRIGPPAVPALAEALNERDKALRCCAAWALGAIGPRAEEAVAALCRALEDENADVRRLAALALVRIDPAVAAENVVPVLIRHLKDPDLSPQPWPALALGEIGPPAERAVPALIQALQDNKTMRVVTARALGRICPGTTQATIHINAKSSDEEVRRAVEEVTAQIRARHAAESPRP